jgi:uncharacterized lipoprotein YehR (DUF1307 family)
MITLKEIACTIRATTKKENKRRYHEVIEKFYGVRGVTSDILY